MPFGSVVVCTSWAPSWNSKPARLAGGGATAGASAGGGAVVSAFGGAAATAVLGVSAGLAGSTFGSGGLAFGGSGFFSFGTMVTVICLSFLPRIPSRAAKKKTARASVPWITAEMIRLTFDELRVLRLGIIRLLL